MLLCKPVGARHVERLSRGPHPSPESVRLIGGTGELELGQGGGERGGIEARHATELVGPCGLLGQSREDSFRVLAELERLALRLLDPNGSRTSATRVSGVAPSRSSAF